MTDTMIMSYTLDQLAADIRTTLKADPGRAGKLAVGHHVERALKDKDFVANHLKTRAKGEDPRAVLYEDAELGFCICGHVYDGPAHGKPHDRRAGRSTTRPPRPPRWPTTEIVEKADGPDNQTPWSSRCAPTVKRATSISRRARRSFAASRRPHAGDPHRGQEPRHGEAEQHQGNSTKSLSGRVGKGRGKRPCPRACPHGHGAPRLCPPYEILRNPEHPLLLLVELREQPGLPREILPRRLRVVVVAARREEQKIDAVPVRRHIRRRVDRQPRCTPRLESTGEQPDVLGPPRPGRTGPASCGAVPSDSEHDRPCVCGRRAHARADRPGGPGDVALAERHGRARSIDSGRRRSQSPVRPRSARASATRSQGSGPAWRQEALSLRPRAAGRHADVMT